MSRIFLFQIILIIVSTCLKAQILTKEHALEDLIFLKKELEQNHAGLYRYTSQEAFDENFENIISLGESTKLDFFKSVRSLLSQIKCGHTNASLPREVYDEFVSNRKFLPVMVKFSDQGLVVTNSSLTMNQLHVGDRILSVDGHDLEVMTQSIFSHLPSDGFTSTGKYRYMESFFYYYHQLFVDNQRREVFSLEIIDSAGQKRMVEVRGKLLAEVESIREIDNQPLLELKHLEDYSFMRIRTFSSSALNEQGLRFNKFLADSFKELKKRQVKKLILDLRDNGGGDDNYGATLVSYFADKPFRYFDNIQVTASYNGYGRISEENGLRYMNSHQGLEEWKPEKDRFEGEVIVLINGFSFSTCADVAAVLHNNKWATFVGEETGGGYDGNTSGSTHSIRLPNSQIQVQIPMWMYTTANVPHAYRGRGVPADNKVIYSVSDLIQKKDPVMDKALQLIKNSSR